MANIRKPSNNISKSMMCTIILAMGSTFQLFQHIKWSRSPHQCTVPMRDMYSQPPSHQHACTLTLTARTHAQMHARTLTRMYTRIRTRTHRRAHTCVVTFAIIFHYSAFVIVCKYVTFIAHARAFGTNTLIINGKRDRSI